MFLRHIVRRWPVQKPPHPRTDTSLPPVGLNEAPHRAPHGGLSRVLLVAGSHRPYVMLRLMPPHRPGSSRRWRVLPGRRATSATAHRAKFRNRGQANFFLHLASQQTVTPHQSPHSLPASVHSSPLQGRKGTARPYPKSPLRGGILGFRPRRGGTETDGEDENRPWRGAPGALKAGDI